MNILKNLYDTIERWFILGIGKISWKYSNGLTESELSTVRTMLTSNYYIIVTHRNNDLSTYFVEVAGLYVSGKLSYWAHSLMNMEDEVASDDDFRLIEATGTGTHYSTFDDVFQVHGVALLKPKSMSVEYWTAVMDKAKSDLGKPYDTLFDITQDQDLSCVELVRNALMAEPNYAIDFSNFEAMIASKKDLTPQMLYDCPDFEVVYEVRHSAEADIL